MAGSKNSYQNPARKCGASPATSVAGSVRPSKSTRSDTNAVGPATVARLGWRSNEVEGTPPQATGFYELSLSSVASIMAIHADAAVRPVPALDRALERHRASLHRYFAVRLGADGATADDLMQQLWLLVSRSTAAVPEADLEAWIRGIARNLIRTHWRVVRRRPPQAPLPDARTAGELSQRLVTQELPAADLERREVRDQLLLALTAMPSEPQQMLIEHYFHGRSHADLSAELGVSERAVEGRLYRARQALRQALLHLAHDGDL
ncbi:ECF RNA polymerase sigma factor SigL [Phycisphaerae bacterium RAS1]|nr:ECF RNA polymerase sigma factor SigL [Phycisphaerae bacterium RAS1]